MSKRLIAAVALLVMALPGFSQGGRDGRSVRRGLLDESEKTVPVLVERHDSSTFAIAYEDGRYGINERIEDNERALRNLETLMETIYRDEGYRFDGINIVSYASPELADAAAVRLSQRRAESIREYILSRYQYAEGRITMDWRGGDIERLTQLIYGYNDLSERYEVLAILLDSSERDPKGRIQRLYGGRTWESLKRDIFPRMERALVTVKYTVVEPDLETVPLDSVVVTDFLVPIREIVRNVDTVMQRDHIQVQLIKRELPRSRIDVGLKTNLLYDLMLIPSIGIEVYMGNGYTLGGGWSGAWWSNDEKHRFWRPYGGVIEGRKYFVKKDEEYDDHIMTGHHIGAYVHLLSYDFELKGLTGDKGYLSRFGYGGGVEYGYAMPIMKHFNLDFTIGVGYIGGKYYEYEPYYSRYVWQATKQRHWIGPTRAEVSLVWLIDLR